MTPSGRHWKRLLNATQSQWNSTTIVSGKLRSSRTGSRREWQQLPPLTDYQLYLLTAAFVERRKTWLTQEQWLALRDAADPNHAGDAS